MPIRPLADQVHIEPIEHPAASSVLIDPLIRQTPVVQFGRCLAVGPGRWPKKGGARARLPMQANPGRVYAFKKGNGLECTDGTLIMYEKQLLGEVEGTMEGQVSR